MPRSEKEEKRRETLRRTMTATWTQCIRDDDSPRIFIAGPYKNVEVSIAIDIEYKKLSQILTKTEIEDLCYNDKISAELFIDLSTEIRSWERSDIYDLLTQ